MSTTHLQHTQKVRGFQHRKYEYMAKKLVWIIRRKKFRCPECGSLKIKEKCRRERLGQGVPMGRLLVYLQLKIHWIYVFSCHKRTTELFHFLSNPNSRITKELEHRILKDQHEMSIRSVAEKYRLRWEQVKEIEKRYLGRKYARIQTAHVRRLGIDEIHTGTNPDRSQRYLTIVRDLNSGEVIHIGEAKKLPPWKDCRASCGKRSSKSWSWTCPTPIRAGSKTLSQSPDRLRSFPCHQADE